MADYIDEIIEREGPETNDPADAGGRTKYGISERANPDLWLNGPPSLAAARTRYMERYVTGPGFDQVTFRPLLHQLVDFGVNAGPERATKELQKLLDCACDGQLGPQTLAALHAVNPCILNNQLVEARKRYYRALAQAKPRNQKFLAGWLRRADEFTLGTS